MKHGVAERLVDVDLRQPNRQVGHRALSRERAEANRAGPARREVGVSHVDRSPHRGGHPPRAIHLLEPVRGVGSVDGHPGAIEGAPACHVSAREAASRNNRPQVLGTDRHAGERLERGGRGRVAEHAPLPRQDERGVFADCDVGEDGLARRGKLQADPRGDFEARIDLRPETLIPRPAGDRQDGRHRPHAPAMLGRLLVRARVIRKGVAGARWQRDEPWRAGGSDEADDGQQQANPAIHIRPRASRILLSIFDRSIDWPSPPSARSQAAAASAKRRCLNRRSPR